MKLRIEKSTGQKTDLSFFPKKDKKINSVSILPRIKLSTQYGYNKNESNTSIILNQENLGISAFINFSWDIFKPGFLFVL